MHPKQVLLGFFFKEKINQPAINQPFEVEETVPPDFYGKSDSINRQLRYPSSALCLKFIFHPDGRTTIKDEVLSEKGEFEPQNLVQEKQIREIRSRHPEIPYKKIA